MYSFYKITDIKTGEEFIGTLEELSTRFFVSKHQIIWCANQQLSLIINNKTCKVNKIKRRSK